MENEISAEDGDAVFSANADSSPGLPSTASLESLQTAEQRALMDLVDRLRRAGLSSLLQLPQIVVCGDQSSGKSSVLEAITEIPFPRRENLCTRFATEIIMRRDIKTSISCKINPDDATPEDMRAKLKAFSKSIQNFEELPSLIDEATAAMGLDNQKAFSRDVLSIEICGPGRPQFTLVDLPGLIHAANKAQSEEDVQLIQSLVETYIKEERTIVLAVISAKNDYANQVILKKCRQFDPKGARTLGIITKPDYLRTGSENESIWLDLAQNRDIYFELGWHVLKNRADDQIQFSFAQRNAQESAFLNTGSYKLLPPHIKGIDALRERLSKLLFDHLKRELPTLKSELDEMTAQTSTALQALGASRATVMDQRIYLTELFTLSCDILHTGVNGIYESAFFGQIDIEAAVESVENVCRLRAVVQHLNMQFAERMCTAGHHYLIEGNETTGVTSNNPRVSDLDAKAPKEAAVLAKKMSRNEAIKWVIQIMRRTRGRELPGTFNPMLISHLFQDQSKRWEGLAHDHIVSVASCCRAFVLHVLDKIANPELKAKLLKLTVLPALKIAQKTALDELELIIKDKKRHPITYNHYFTDTLQKMQQERQIGRIKRLASHSTVEVPEMIPGTTRYEGKQYMNCDQFSLGLQRTIEQNMDKVSAEQALDAHDAYYKDERKYFIGVITKQAVERHLMAPLPDILSPKVLARYADQEIRLLAAEPPEAIQMREFLQNKKKMLEDGQEAFALAMGEHL